MAFKMKGPTLKKDGKRQPLRPVTGNTVQQGKTKKKGTKKVNIPVNPKAPKVKVPKNNTSIKGKTQFEVDTQGVRNAIGKFVNTRNQVKKKIKQKVKSRAKEVKDYFTKR